MAKNYKHDREEELSQEDLVRIFSDANLAREYLPQTEATQKYFDEALRRNGNILHAWTQTITFDMANIPDEDKREATRRIRDAARTVNARMDRPKEPVARRGGAGTRPARRIDAAAVQKERGNTEQEPDPKKG